MRSGASEEMMSEPSELQRRAVFMLSESRAQKVMNARNRVSEIFSGSELKAINEWMETQNDPSLDRPEAIRRLVELGLKAQR